jgi:hypothetical protein
MNCAFVIVFDNCTLPPNKPLVHTKILKRQSSNRLDEQGQTELTLKESASE